MAERFFVEDPIQGDRAELLGAESHHLTHVLRARVDDVVTLFDGSGAEYAARVARIDRARVILEVGIRSLPDRELPFQLTIGVSLPRGDRQKWLVEKLTELGVTQLVPLITHRTGVEPGSGTHERLRRAAIEAAKQCGRNRLPEISPPQEIADYLRSPAPDAERYLAHPRLDGSPQIQRQRKSAVYVAIGPEGGFVDEELALALELGWTTIDLGPRILRIETAAIAIAAVLGIGGERPGERPGERGALAP